MNPAQPNGRIPRYAMMGLSARRNYCTRGMMKKFILVPAAIALLAGCRQPPLPPRDTSTPARALVGHWKDEKVWGWEEYFTADGNFFITINKDVFHRGTYEPLLENPALRSLKIFMVGRGTSRGVRMFIQGRFSSDFSVFTGTISQSSAGGPYTDPSALRWRFLDTRQRP